MAIDFEMAWHALAADVAGKQGIGTNALLAMMKRLEVEHSFDEEVVVRAMRRYGVSLGEDLRRAARGESVVPAGDESPGVGEAAPLDPTTIEPGHEKIQEDHHGDRSTNAGRAHAARV